MWKASLASNTIPLGVIVYAPSFICSWQASADVMKVHNMRKVAANYSVQWWASQGASKGKFRLFPDDTGDNVKCFYAYFTACFVRGVCDVSGKL